MSEKFKCNNCDDVGWVCENHPNMPFVECECGGAGEPCEKCNVSDRDNPPRMPEGFEESE